MNPHLPINDDDRFDLLADGELDEADRRELLSRLDGEPDGWRRCAMAFLEAQEWRGTLGAMAAENDPSRPSPMGATAGLSSSAHEDLQKNTAGQASSGTQYSKTQLAQRLACSMPPIDASLEASSRPRRFGPRSPAGRLFAMVASFSAAMLLAWHVQGLRQSGPVGVSPANNQLAENPSTNHQVAENPSANNPVAPQRVAPMTVTRRGAVTTRSAPVAGQSETTNTKVYLIDLPGGTGPAGQAQTVRLRAVEREQIGRDWPDSLPSPISAELLRELELAGLRVEQQQGLLPLKMQDGRSLVVPLNDVNIRYVGKPTL